MKTYHPDLQAQYDLCEQVRDGYPAGHNQIEKITIQMEDLQLKIENNHRSQDSVGRMQVAVRPEPNETL